MSAPLIWIGIPFLAAVLLIFLLRFRRLTPALGTLIALLLAFAAWKLPINQVIIVGNLSFKITDTFELFGRRFVVDKTTLFTLEWIYLIIAFWFGGSYTASAGPPFVPIGLGIMAIMTAALTVDPFLYAALLIELAALMSVPLLLAPGHPAGRGVMRFLTFQTVGTPFILFSGWMLEGVQAAPADLTGVLRSSLFLGMGFAFLLAVFPFHSWIPMLAEEAQPYAAAFVFTMLPGIISFLGINFLARFVWLRESSVVYLLLQGAGALMIATGGLWAAFQRHLGRMLGYGVMVEIGLSILAVGLFGQSQFSIQTGGLLDLNAFALRIFFALFITRGLGMGLWALALSSILSKAGSLSFRAVQGIGRSLPLSTAALVLAQFSTAGFPLLAGFPVRLALIQEIAAASPITAFWVIFGSLGLLIGGFRSLAVLILGPEENPWKIEENRLAFLLLGIGIIFLFVLGLSPRI